MASIEYLLLVMAIVIPLGFLSYFGQVALANAYQIQLLILSLPIG